MTRWTSLIVGAVAGMWGGSALGWLELAWLTLQGAGGDASLPAWAHVLYGLAGVVPGAAGGLLVAAVSWKFPDVTRFAAAAGFGAAWAPLTVAVGRYLLNRDVFAEQGLSGAGWLAVGLAAAVPVVVAAAGSALRRPRGDQAWFLMFGGWAAVAVLGVTFALALGPSRPFHLRLPDPGVPDPPGSGGPIVIVLVDTLRADALEGASGPLPAFDQLRRDSIVFPDAWAPAAWTRPSIASLWTSRLPSGHTASTKGSRLPGQVVTFAEALRPGGYRTGALVNNINVTAGFGFDQGFDLFHYEAPEYPFGASEAVFSLALYKVLHRVEERVRGGGPVERYYQPAHVVLGHALQWLESHRGRRSVLFVHLMEPHDPYFLHEESASGTVSFGGYARAANPVPAPDEATALRERYAGEVRHLDRQLGKFLQDLRDLRHYDSLTLVLTSDHGEEFYEHGGWWHGDSLHGEQTRVPLWIKLPNQELAGTSAPWRVRTLDVAPTLTNLAGIGPDPTWEGRDLLGPAERAALAGAPAPGPALAADPATACRQGRTHPLDRVVVQEEDFEGNVLWGVRAEGVAWLRAKPGGVRLHPERALYDVIADPGETRDLKAAGAALCATFPDDWGQDLEQVYERAVGAARAGGATPEAAPGLSASERARLCALGYLTGPECP